MFQFLCGLMVGSEMSKNNRNRVRKPDVALFLAFGIMAVVLAICIYFGNGLLGVTHLLFWIFGALVVLGIIFFTIIQPKAALPLVVLLILLIGCYQLISPMIQDLEAQKVLNEKSGNKNKIINLL